MSEQEMREKVIKGLECCVNDLGECEVCPYDEGMGKLACGKNLYSDALALLKAQEPVEPKYVEFEDTGLTWEKYEVATCGKCGALLGDALYCPMCGQAVKWE